MAKPTDETPPVLTVTAASRIVDRPKALFAIHDDNRHVEYYTALGGMLHMFSMVEQTLPYLIHIVTETDKNTIKAIMYKQRVDTCIKSIKNFVAAKKLQSRRIKEILKTLDHLASINTIRNDILHLGGRLNPSGQSIKIDNYTTAFGPGVKRSTTINIKHIESMQHDLMLMTMLWLGHDKAKKGKIPPPQAQYAATSAANVRKSIPLGEPIPWLYKPLLPKGPANRHPKKRRSPKRPPGSSRA